MDEFEELTPVDRILVRTSDGETDVYDAGLQPADLRPEHTLIGFPRESDHGDLLVVEMYDDGSWTLHSYPEAHLARFSVSGRDDDDS